MDSQNSIFWLFFSVEKLFLSFVYVTFKAKKLVHFYWQLGLQSFFSNLQWVKWQSSQFPLEDSGQYFRETVCVLPSSLKQKSQFLFWSHLQVSFISVTMLFQRPLPAPVPWANNPISAQSCKALLPVGSSARLCGPFYFPAHLEGIGLCAFWAESNSPACTFAFVLVILWPWIRKLFL